MPGEAELLIAARKALLDALSDQRDALILIGAQAVYMHTGAAPVALAEATKDSDLAVDPRLLVQDPLLDEAMKAAGFHHDLLHPQPGGWLSPDGIPVDLMVPDTLAGDGTGRGARIPPHHKHATRRTPGLEACVVDHSPMTISALDSTDDREARIEVAGPAALLVAKLHKLGERAATPSRLVDKDAHDIYRLLVATETRQLARRLHLLLDDAVSASATTEAISYLKGLFATGSEALGSTMAGRAEQLVGDPAVVAASVAALAADALEALHAGPGD